MKRPVFFGIWIFLITFLGAQDKKMLDHSDYEKWNSIRGRVISVDGSWVGYVLSHENRDGEAVLVSTRTGNEYRIVRGDSIVFSDVFPVAILKIKAPKDSVRQAKLKKKKKEDMPPDSLVVIHLETGQQKKFPRVLAVRVPDEQMRAIAFLQKPETTNKDKEKSDDADKKIRKEKNEKFYPMVLLDLNSFNADTIKNIQQFTFSKNGQILAFVGGGPDSMPGGVGFLETGSRQKKQVFQDSMKYSALAVDERGTFLTFIRNMHRGEEAGDSLTLYLVSISDGQKTPLVGFEAGQKVKNPQVWMLHDGKAPRFSSDGKRLFFSLKKKYPEAKNDSIPEDEQVKVDIWHYRDPYLQPMQLKQQKEEREKAYTCMLDLASGRYIQLENEEVETVFAGKRGTVNHFVGWSGIPYRMEISWDYPGYVDIYGWNFGQNKWEKLVKKIQDQPQISPDGRYAAWWDREEKVWKILDAEKRSIIIASAGIDEDLREFDHDLPYLADSYGAAGWTKDGKSFIVYGKYDLYLLDPTGKKKARNLTGGYGEKNGVRLRYIRLDEEEEGIDLTRPVLLYGFHYQTKYSGYFFWQNGQVKQLMLEPKRFGYPMKAKSAEMYLYTREDFQEFPDLWIAGNRFSDPKKISEANPQQKEYRWGTAELIHWYSLDGRYLDGILYKPENFDPSRKYPMMVYFYEKNSDNLYAHWIPQPHRSIINFTFYVSRGYLVFVPDIHYKVGYPGESAVNCVLPGVTSLIEKGFVDPARIGVQGHSWGGYQVAYLVTRTDIFAAAEAGAPVSNMFSAYGGIRWESGMSRMFQYEKTQSRIGPPIWQGFLQYLENSPLFWLEKVKTPLLIMHNDQDGAVPWYQGIELFVALRRLGKPAWMLNYNNQPHWVNTWATRLDWAIRMQQFFDHYLKDSPAPRWMKEGVPAVLKGTTLGLETDKAE